MKRIFVNVSLGVVITLEITGLYFRKKESLKCPLHDKIDCTGEEDITIIKKNKYDDA